MKEPESAPEHCLPGFGGGQHFFEYLLVVSLKKRRSGESYEPTITYQFPKVRTAGRGGGTEDRVSERQQVVGGPSLSLPSPGWLSLELP